MEASVRRARHSQRGDGDAQRPKSQLTGERRRWGKLQIDFPNFL